MTYQTLQNLTAGLLTGDNRLPNEPEIVLSMLEYALTTVATKADSLHLMTLSTEVDVLRMSVGDYLIRRPALPILLTDNLDIDDELGFAVARLIASMVSKEKGGIHVQAADRIILDYNAKVYEIIDQMQSEAIAEGIDCADTPCDTSFSL